jgi:hypothetical protein
MTIQWTFLPSLVQICFVVSEKKMKMWNSHRVQCNVHWMVLYQICVFGADLKSNMAARVHNVFSLAEILKNLLVRNHQANWIVTLGSNVKLSRVMVAILNFRSANDSQV